MSRKRITFHAEIIVNEPYRSQPGYTMPHDSTDAEDLRLTIMRHLFELLSKVGPSVDISAMEMQTSVEDTPA